MQRLLCAGAVAGLLAAGCGSDETPNDHDASTDVVDAGDGAADGGGTDAGAVAPIDEFPGLSAPAEVLRDAQGMPHIFAANDLDLFYAAGYTLAADRLFALDMERRAAVGRLAEVLGEDGVDADVQALAIGFERWAEPSVDALRAEAPEVHNLLIAWTAGLNAYVAAVEAGEAPRPAGYDELAFDPTPFAVSDPLAIGLRITFGFSSTLEFDLLNQVIEVLSDDRLALPVHQPTTSSFTMELPDRLGETKQESVAWSDDDLRAFADWIGRWRRTLGSGEGSNGWVVSGDHTATGRPILANDSHAGFKSPSRLYAYHLNSADAGGTFDVVGVAFMGVPGVQVGHNRHVAWGATTNFADQTDLWDVEVDEGVVTYGDEQLELVTTERSFRVRLEDGSFEERSIEHREVPGVGVLLPDELLPVPPALLVQGELLLGWPGFEPNLDLRTYLGFDRASSLDDFVAAVDTQRTGMQNWVVASADGYRYHVNGLVPDRRAAGGQPEAHRIMDGSDPLNVWTGAYLPDSQLPSNDGTLPFHATANNDPWGHTDDNNPLNDAFYYGSWYAPQFRSGRLYEALTEATQEGGIDVAATQALQMEVTSVAAQRFQVLLDAAWAEAIPDGGALGELTRDPDVGTGYDTLSAWDAEMTTDSGPAALYRIWVSLLSRALLEDDLTLLYLAVEEAQPVYITKLALLILEDGDSPFLQESRAQLMLEQLGEAYRVWTERGEPTWGESHETRFGRPDRTWDSEVRAGGDSSLNVAQCRFWDGDDLLPACVSDQGAVYRMVHAIGEDGVPVLEWNLPYVLPDATQDWLDGVYREVPFSRADVDAAATSSETLEP